MQVDVALVLLVVGIIYVFVLLSVFVASVFLSVFASVFGQLAMLMYVFVSPAGVWHSSSCSRPLDNARQGLPGGAAQEPAVHEHHLHHPRLLHPHDPPLRLWLVRRRQGDQVFPPHLLRPPLPPLHHHHGRWGSRLCLQRAGLLICNLGEFKIVKCQTASLKYLLQGGLDDES